MIPGGDRLTDLQDAVLKAAQQRANGVVIVCAICEQDHSTHLHRAIDAAT